MAVVKFSPDFLYGSTYSVQSGVVGYLNQSPVPRFYGGRAAGSFFAAGNGNIYSGAVANCGVFYVMSGPKPNIATLTTTPFPTPPAGTKVLWWSSAADSITWGPIGNNWYTDPTIISSRFVQTIDTGTASWFWIGTSNANFGSSLIFPSEIIHSITGDIGELGSGADLEMLTTNVTAGQYLRILNLNLKMPLSLF